MNFEEYQAQTIARSIARGLERDAYRARLARERKQELTGMIISFLVVASGFIYMGYFA